MESSIDTIDRKWGIISMKMINHPKKKGDKEAIVAKMKNMLD